MEAKTRLQGTMGRWNRSKSLTWTRRRRARGRSPEESENTPRSPEGTSAPCVGCQARRFSGGHFELIQEWQVPLRPLQDRHLRREGLLGSLKEQSTTAPSGLPTTAPFALSDPRQSLAQKEGALTASLRCAFSSSLPQQQAVLESCTERGEGFAFCTYRICV